LSLTHAGTHPIGMKHGGFWGTVARLRSTPRQLFSGATLAVLLCSSTVAQTPAAEPSAIDPLPPDNGAAGLKQVLRRLQTTARLLQVTAHPDDEDGGMLTLESRGRGATVQLLTLTRGEGGQNKVGSNLFDVLGVVRTLEQTASDRYYGVEQRFTRVADFGYSKTADETFQKWQGHDIALDDMVRVIRTFRPDVLIARFSGTDRDGHGHHQASALLTREAFRAAADPARFPEQIKEGLQPWQTKKLYIGNVCGFMSNTCPDGNWTVKLNTGQVDPLLGMSYIQFAMKGLRHQLSQGAGGWRVDPGDRFTYYKLVDSWLPPADHNGHEQDFFDGIDTSFPGLAGKLGPEEKEVPWLRGGLKQIAEQVSEAARRADKDPGACAEPLFQVLQELGSVTDRINQSGLTEAGKASLLPELRQKQKQTQDALSSALGLSLQATVLLPDSAPPAAEAEPAEAALSPGQKFAVTVKFRNGSEYPVRVEHISLQGISSPSEVKSVVVPPGQEHSALFRTQVPADEAATRPYWHRANPETESINTIDDPKDLSLPFSPFRFFATVRYSIASERISPANRAGAPTPSLAQIMAPILMPVQDDPGGPPLRRLAIVPAFSVMLEPGEQVVPLANGHARTVRVEIACNLTGAPRGTLRLELPEGWRSQPSQAEVTLPSRGAKQDLEFKVFPQGLKESRAEIRAVLDAGGKQYSEGYSLVTREDLDAFYYYQPATQRVSIVDVKVPKDLRVGYVMGAGDDIPTVLRHVGLDVTELAAEKLGSEDLSRYGTIVLGIRAYDTQKDVAANNKKLLDFVSDGGTLVVQYNTGVGDFNNGHFTPFPAQLSRARVSVEEAPVDILAPEDSVFRSPNQITPADFDGWVQERGLYFMDNWDSHFKPLLACHDPGEPPQKGGLLRAQYGKGTYIYTGYAFFRQLPNGVPGAVRLFVNLLSAGH
jgi:LmbE family N-acetylglucosaminyl deacetylase